ncbi:hypothetical protein EsDP_00002400 [Epichloe bromicola]|uniref:Uncharacterized protein n=1 Tax=Epichloe bromicola TaxID=79588 RepID=A0ABQ0CKQ5_9HYPO
MWPFSHCSSDSDSDSCAVRNPNKLDSQAVVALLPFAAAFIIVDILAARHVFPRLSRAHNERGAKGWKRRGAAWVFGTTVSLAVMLGLLILGEILEVVDPVAKNLALHATVPSLLFLLVALVPWLQCRAVVTGAGWSFDRDARGAVSKVAWGLQFALFGAWLFSFWAVGGSVLPDPASDSASDSARASRGDGDGDGDWDWRHQLTKECLERVGVVGICLMALLAGFASVSTPWHTLVDGPSRRKRPVTEADINRKRAGLEATSEMLATKRHQLRQLRQLERRAAAKGKSCSGGLVGNMMMMMGSTFGATMSGDEAEMRALRMEIAGLETMEANLASNLSLMRNHRAATARASTVGGRIMLAPSYVLAAYCVYRVLATMLTTLLRRGRVHRSRSRSPSPSFADTDPISRFLGLMARHWDPELDQLAWARTISFALSGVILLASANSAVQTFHLLAKWAPPGRLRHARASLALAVGQVTATHVISASLLLRSQLPARAGGAVTRLLQGAPSPGFVDRWFETWFLLGCALSALGIWMGRKLSRFDDDWDDYGAEEMGAKRL